MDLTGTDPAKALAVASRMMDAEPNAGPLAVQDPQQAPGPGMDALAMSGAAPSAMQMIGPERQVAKAGDIMKNALARCLTRLGYREFRLTSQQRRKLNKLPVGTDSRHVFLHELASNPQILEAQSLR